MSKIIGSIPALFCCALIVLKVTSVLTMSWWVVVLCPILVGFLLPSTRECDCDDLIVQGARGPVGPMGPKGEKGDPCECSKHR